MKSKHNLQYIAGFAKVIMTLLILLLTVNLLQSISIDTEKTLMRARLAKYLNSTVKEEPNETKKQLQMISVSEKLFLPEGSIYLLYDYKDILRRERPDKEQIYDVNGYLLWEDGPEDIPFKYLSWATPFRSWCSISLEQLKMLSPIFAKTLQIPIMSKGKAVHVWRYDPGSDFFTGYNITQGGKIGYLSSVGFTKSKVQAKPMGRIKFCAAWIPADSYNPTMLFQTGQSVYEINFEQKKVKVLFESPEGPIKYIRQNVWGFYEPELLEDPNIEYRPMIHCLTEDNKHHLVMQNPNQELTIAVPEDWPGESVYLTATTQGIFLYYEGTEERPPVDYAESSHLWQQWQDNYKKKAHKSWVEFYKVGEQSSLEFLNRFDWTVPAKDEDDKNDVVSETRPFVTAVSPPLYDLAWFLFADQLWLSVPQDTKLVSICGEIVKNTQPVNSIYNLVLSIFMIGFTFWHGLSRRTCWGKFIFWLVLVGLFNLAGLLTYLALNHTTVIKCSACGRHRSLEKLDCVRCGAELPLPQRRELDLVFKT